MTTADFRQSCSAFAALLQERITAALEALDGTPFREELWRRSGGGGGRTRILSGGPVLEKGGVNFSEVHGEVSAELARSLAASLAPASREPRTFFATGLSLVLHPLNPRAPAVHANLRYLEHGGTRWLGGGADLTPHFLEEEDAVHFHRVWKQVCDRHDPSFYPRFKRWCDEYFFLPHRQEARGIGGIFFDRLEANEAHLAFWRDVGEAFLDAYLPILERRHREPYTERERTHQLRRRGRYVEFNLLYDRGTRFGLESGGRSESILMSLPPLVRWDEGAAPEPDSPEARLLEVLRRPRDWLAAEGPAGPAAPRA